MTDPDEQAARAAAAALRRAAATPTRRPGPVRAKGRRDLGAAGSGGRDPQPLSQALEGLIRDQGWTQESTVAIVFSDWARIVGEELAAHVGPQSYADATLTLRAESTAWATQVRLLLPVIHRSVDEAVETGVVRTITVLGPTAPSWTFGPRRVKGRGPRDTFG
jgi:predicted nucleic acid-binding Zn ribbon protein